MMLQQTNKFMLASLALIACVLLMPASAFASSKTSHANQQSAMLINSTAGKNFCSSINELSGKLIKDIADRETRYATKETEKQNALADTLSKRDAARLEARTTWNTSREEVFANLNARAQTEKETAAIETFRNQIDTAVSVRRNSIDTALTTFRTGVDKTLKERKSGVESAISIFRTTNDAALVKAKASCGNGAPSPVVREAYVEDLTQGKQAFLVAVQAAQKKDNAIKQLVKERDASVEAALAAFKKALNQAQQNLKKSFLDA